MSKLNNVFPFLLFGCLYPTIDLEANAQLPPKIEPPKAPAAPSIETPQEPQLNIEKIPEVPQVDTFPTLTVKKFEFIDNTVVSTNDLQPIIQKYIGKTIGTSELRLIRDSVTKLYADKGYVNSGVAILLIDNAPIDLTNAVIKIRIIEGELGEIRISGSKKLIEYIKDRLSKKGQILNSNHLIEKLRLLSDDPLIKQINAKLIPSDAVNRSNLEVEVKPSKPYTVELFADNYRNSNVGSFERGVDFLALNPFSEGGKLTFRFSNSNGSNTIQSSYSRPITRDNTTLTFQYAFGNNSVITSPVNILDIKSSSQSYFLGIRHPILRHASDKDRIEIGLGFGIEHRENQDNLLGFDFPVSRGSDNNGLTKLSVLSFSQDATYRDISQAVSLRSEVRFGVDIGSVTGPGYDRGQFWAWRGDAQWARKLPWELLFATRVGLQFSDRPLVASEQLSLGGISTIPGYPQDSYLSDNGIYGGFSLSKAINIGKYGRLSIGPFFNIGYGWGNGAFDESPQLLAAPGISLDYEINQSFYGSLSYGIPIFSNNLNRRNLQADGLSLSVRYVF
jgi:hemolysin activation/secretion protein